MTEIKGIDVSRWNGNIDWKTVASYGMGFAILRITEKGNVVDSTFEPNYKGCTENKIPVGVYKYSYATSVMQIQEEAKIVVKTLNKRKLTYPIFLDIEDKCQVTLSQSLMMQMIDAFKNIVVKAGYKFGIYCGRHWYDTKLPEKAKKYDCWLAAYPSNDDGTLQERLRPNNGIGWQYSSKATIPGISTKVDRNVFYKDYSKENNNSNSTDKEENVMANLWTKTNNLLKEQVGYLEKRSNSNLDSKTGNAGYNNYTKYSRDVNNMGLMGCQGQPWCATYQFWICCQIFGKSKALDIMGNGFYNCNSVKSHSRAKGTWHSSPKVGALVIFRNGAHIGRVISISGNTIRTNEGNTSSGGLNHVEANGGCVAEKSYTIGNRQIDGYVWIDYGNEVIPSKPETPWKPTGTATSTVDNLFVRAEPNGEVLGELMTGNRFEIDGKTSGMWTHVKVAGIGVAWVATKYVKKDGQDKPVQNPTKPSKPSNKPSNTIINKQDKRQRLFVGKVTASELCVRTWAGTERPQIKSYPTLGRGNLVDVMNYTQKDSNGADWYYIRIAGKYFGFVSAQYIERQ